MSDAVKSVSENQVTLDKILNANDVPTLEDLLKKANSTLAELEEHHQASLTALEKTPAQSPSTDVASRFQTAIAEAKTAAQNTYFAIMICEKLTQLEPKNTDTHKIEIEKYKEQIKEWVKKSGSLLQGALKAKVSLGAAKPAMFSGSKPATSQVPRENNPAKTPKR